MGDEHLHLPGEAQGTRSRDFGPITSFVDEFDGWNCAKWRLQLELSNLEVGHGTMLMFLIYKLGTPSTYPKEKHTAFLYSRIPTPNRSIPSTGWWECSRETWVGWPGPLVPAKISLEQLHFDCSNSKTRPQTTNWPLLMSQWQLKQQEACHCYWLGFIEFNTHSFIHIDINVSLG